MKKYSVLVRGENFLIKFEGEDQKLGFYTTAFVEAKDEDEASKKAVDLLRDDQEFKRSVSNDQSDPPLMFVDEIAELESFDGLNLPRNGFAFFPEEEENEAGGA
jgi:hypothetical protein